VNLHHEEKVRDLCQRAMYEQDVIKLLRIFLELDWAVEQAQRHTAPQSGLKTWQDYPRCSRDIA